MRRYSIEPRTIKYVKGHGFLPFARKYNKQLLDTELNASEFLGNEIADAVSQTMITL